MSDLGTDQEGLTWQVRRGAQVRGPYASAQVRRFVHDGRLQLDDEVSRDGVRWQRLGAVPEVVPLHLRRGSALNDGILAAQVHRELGGAIKGILVISTLIILVVGIVLWQGGRPSVPVANCEADATPGVNWGNCRLDGLRATSSDLSGSTLSNASLINAALGHSRLSGADMSYVNLTGAVLSYAQLDGVRLLGANLRGADLTHAELTAADLSFADLTGALVGGARLVGARLNGAIWVDGRKCAAPSLGECN